MNRVVNLLKKQVYGRYGPVRKASALALEGFRRASGRRFRNYYSTPPVLANSFPKSGTHLLAQLVSALPGCDNYGRFLASMTSSFRFRERTVESVRRFVETTVPGEILRGHLFYDAQYVDDLAKKNIVHYFIFRDPRDVAVSEAHYLRYMNRWHRLHPYFRRLPSMEAAISLAICGLEEPARGIEFPNIGKRFARYRVWLDHPDVLPIRYEDLNSEDRRLTLLRMAEFFAAKNTCGIDTYACAGAMEANIAPMKSHTFRKGKSNAWKGEFTERHRQQFLEVAGDILIDLGYEKDEGWLSLSNDAK